MMDASSPMSSSPAETKDAVSRIKASCLTPSVCITKGPSDLSAREIATHDRWISKRKVCRFKVASDRDIALRGELGTIKGTGLEGSASLFSNSIVLL